MIGLDEVKVGVVGMRSHSTRGVSKGDDILLELDAEFWYGENTVMQ